MYFEADMSEIQTFGARFKGFVSDACIVVGASSITYAAWLIAVPFGYAVGGILLIIGGIIAGIKARV